MTSRLLVVTVGGAPEPVVTSLLHWRPARAVFIVTAQTRDAIAREIFPRVQQGGWAEFDAGRYDLHELPDPQDFNGIVDRLRGLDHVVGGWTRDHPGAEVITDLTGGTKAMSAGLALAAMRWPCRFSYVGGTERTKGGVGVVVSGREQVLQTLNPADTLGLLALDSALELLRTHAFAAAEAVLQQAVRRVTEPARKAELGAVSSLAGALADWDCFQHRTALNKLRELPRHTHNLAAALGPAIVPAALAATSRLTTHLAAIVAAGPGGPSRPLILDLLANARRRLDERRWDDATARLYRVVEATAQFHLAAAGLPSTSAVPLVKVPEPLRGRLTPYASDGLARLGLQDAWELLQHLRPDVVRPFAEASLDHREKSPLVARNQSILAHGFAPVSEKLARQLFAIALKLLPARETDLPEAPTAALNLPSATLNPP